MKPVAWWDGNPKNAIGISKTKDCDDWLPLYTHPADVEKVKENMDKVLKQNERLIEALENARITFDAEIEKKNTMLKMWEVTHPAKTLTDEEIWDVWADFTNCDGEFTEPEAELLFAREILRKVQEK